MKKHANNLKNLEIINSIKPGEIVRWENGPLVFTEAVFCYKGHPAADGVTGPIPLRSIFSKIEVVR